MATFTNIKTNTVYELPEGTTPEQAFELIKKDDPSASPVDFEFLDLPKTKGLDAPIDTQEYPLYARGSIINNPKVAFQYALGVGPEIIYEELRQQQKAGRPIKFINPQTGKDWSVMDKGIPTVVEEYQSQEDMLAGRNPARYNITQPIPGTAGLVGQESIYGVPFMGVAGKIENIAAQGIGKAGFPFMSGKAAQAVAASAGTEAARQATIQGMTPTAEYNWAEQLGAPAIAGAVESRVGEAVKRGIARNIPGTAANLDAVMYERQLAKNPAISELERQYGKQISSADIDFAQKARERVAWVGPFQNPEAIELGTKQNMLRAKKLSDRNKIVDALTGTNMSQDPQAQASLEHFLDTITPTSVMETGPTRIVSRSIDQMKADNMKIAKQTADVYETLKKNMVGGQSMATIDLTPAADRVKQYLDQIQTGTHVQPAGKPLPFPSPYEPSVTEVTTADEKGLTEIMNLLHIQKDVAADPSGTVMRKGMTTKFGMEDMETYFSRLYRIKDILDGKVDSDMRLNSKLSAQLRPVIKDMEDALNDLTKINPTDPGELVKAKQIASENFEKIRQNEQSSIGGRLFSATKDGAAWAASDVLFDSSKGITPSSIRNWKAAIESSPDGKEIWREMLRNQLERRMTAAKTTMNPDGTYRAGTNQPAKMWDAIWGGERGGDKELFLEAFGNDEWGLQQKANFEFIGQVLDWAKEGRRHGSDTMLNLKSEIEGAARNVAASSIGGVGAASAALAAQTASVVKKWEKDLANENSARLLVDAITDPSWAKKMRELRIWKEIYLKSPKPSILDNYSRSLNQLFEWEQDIEPWGPGAE